MIDARAFFEAYAAAWQARDLEALMSFLTVPQLIVTPEASHFLETEDEVRANVAALLAKYDEQGVAAVEIVRLDAEPLPDDALRVTVRWRLDDSAARPLIEYATIYTLAPDESEPDAVPRIVAIDARGEMAAWAAAGWA
jgi:hypothetical protein